jgi:hypothetical protein
VNKFRLRLKLAQANVLAAHEDIDELKFWGRVEGLTKAYYILLGLAFRKAYEFPHKTFFYAYSSPHSACLLTLSLRSFPSCCCSTRDWPRNSTRCHSSATPTRCS